MQSHCHFVLVRKRFRKVFTKGSKKVILAQVVAILAQAILLKPFFACAGKAGFCLRARRLMGRNRKWVLQDDIQEAVWRTILRGPRPPSNKWEMRSKSDVSKSHSTFSKGVSKKDPPASMKPVQAKTIQKGHPWQDSETPRAVVSRSGHGGSSCQSAQVAGGSHHVGRGRRDVPHNFGSKRHSREHRNGQYPSASSRHSRLSTGNGSGWNEPRR